MIDPSGCSHRDLATAKGRPRATRREVAPTATSRAVTTSTHSGASVCDSCRTRERAAAEPSDEGVFAAKKMWEVLLNPFVRSGSATEARRHMKQFVVEGLAIAAVLTGSALAHAEEGAPAATGEPPAAKEAAPATASTPAAPAAAGVGTGSTVADGARFRFGVSGGAGFFTVASETGPGSVSATYFGTDLRFGAQINNLIGVYAQPTLGYYTANGS